MKELTDLITTLFPEIPINVPLVDSLSLRIPLDKCQVIDERITSRTAIYYEESNAIYVQDDEDWLPAKPLEIKYNGITIRIGLTNINLYEATTAEYIPTQFLVLTVSSKLLKGNYFKGITIDTIRDVYEEFLRFEVFTCEYTDFLEGIVCDIDICFNRYSDSQSVFMQALHDLYNQCGTMQKWVSPPFDRRDNKGLQFHDRRFATPAAPHIKIYHKELELLSKSADFYNFYLYPQYGHEIKNLTRVEATIKNYDHKKRLVKHGVMDDFRTLEELLLLPQKQLYNVIIDCLNCYIKTKARIRAPDLSPTEHIMFELIQNCVMAGYDHKSLLQIVETFKGSSDNATKVAKSRMRRTINELFDLLVHKDVKIMSKASHNAHVLTYLEFIGIKL